MITCIGTSEKEDKKTTVRESLTIKDSNINPFETGEYKPISKEKYEEYYKRFKFRKIRRMLSANISMN